MALIGIGKTEHLRTLARISTKDDPGLQELAGELHLVYNDYENALEKIRLMVERYEELKTEVRKREYRLKRELKHLFILSILLFLFNPVALMAQTDTLGNDGPYVFNQSGKRTALVVKNGKAELVSARRNIRVSIAQGTPDLLVRLKKELIIEPSFYPEPEKIFAVSDIEGELQGFIKLMVANKIMDKHYHWTFGKGHLVIAGDLFDRGNQVTEYLWLLYHLEDKARAAGGYVHVILGNHDIMNLSGNLRYLDKRYLASAKAMGLDYMKLYAKDTELGSWLRTKNVMEKIGDQLFLHAGLSPKIVALNLSLQKLNELSRPYYDCKPALLPDGLKLLLGGDSPFWYRGYFLAPRISMQELDASLALYGVSRIIVGHTIVNRNITSYYGGKVIGIDVDQHSGQHFGALYTGGKWQVAGPDGGLAELLYRPENDQLSEKDIL